MAINRPVASVTGQDEWEWNRWQTALQSADEPTGTVDTRPTSDVRASSQEVADLQRRVRSLERELARRERHLQDVIDHYERLLERKNRRIADLESGSSTRSWRASMVSTLRSYGAQY